MALFKRKEEKKEYNGASVLLKRKKVPIRKQLKQKAKTKKSSKKKFRKRRSWSINVLVIVGIIAAVGAVFGLTYGVYQSALWVIDTRASKVIIEENNGEVLGFSNVPVYPQSEYIFTPTNEPDPVKEFTSTGRSIYRLDWDEDIEDVFQFYKEELPDNGWKHLLSVPRTSKDKLYGEYWISEEGETGLRIYNRINDIWYEKITPAEAESGLADRLAKDLERDLLISSGSGTDLLPDFPWSLTVPNEYLIRYFPTDEGDLRGVQFVKNGTELEYIFEPISKLDGELQDLYLEKYIDMVNVRLEAGEDDHRWSIVNSKYTNIGGKEVLEGSVTSTKGDGLIYILVNNDINYSYAYFQPHGDNAFTQFFLKSVKEKRSELGGDDFNFTN